MRENKEVLELKIEITQWGHNGLELEGVIVKSFQEICFDHEHVSEALSRSKKEVEEYLERFFEKLNNKK